MKYYEGICYLTSANGEQRTFSNERDMEAFQARCPHPETCLANDGFRYCSRCWALPKVTRGRI